MSHMPLNSETVNVPFASVITVAAVPAAKSAEIKEIRAPLSGVRVSESKAVPRTLTKPDVACVWTTRGPHADNQSATVQTPNFSNDRALITRTISSRDCLRHRLLNPSAEPSDPR
jgi:hypothetical protein